MIVVPPRPPLLPKELQPNDYLIVTLIVIIVCGIFNITSLVFSIPALICSVMVSGNTINRTLILMSIFVVFPKKGKKCYSTLHYDLKILNGLCKNLPQICILPLSEV